MRKIVTVNVDTMYLLLRRHLPGGALDKTSGYQERFLLAEIKRIFTRQGIAFYDRPGLYPLPPCHYNARRVGGELVITITQGHDDE